MIVANKLDLFVGWKNDTCYFLNRVDYDDQAVYEVSLIANYIKIAI